MDATPRTRPVRSGLSRRQLLAGGVLTAATLTACDILSTEPKRDGAAETPNGGDAKEAPGLADRVAAGKLPPLADRLPTEPVVVQPVERVGTYGGEWNTVLAGPTSGPG